MVRDNLNQEIRTNSPMENITKLVEEAGEIWRTTKRLILEGMPRFEPFNTQALFNESKFERIKNES